MAGEVRLVACCDLFRQRAAAFGQRNDIPAGAIYTDYHEMPAREKLDIVSVATNGRQDRLPPVASGS